MWRACDRPQSPVNAAPNQQETLSRTDSVLNRSGNETRRDLQSVKQIPQADIPDTETFRFAGVDTSTESETGVVDGEQ